MADMDVSLFQSISTARLKQWATQEGENVYVRLPDGTQEARLTPAEWRLIVARFEGKVIPSAWWMRLACILTLPFGIMLLLTIGSVPALRSAFDAFNDTIPIVLPLLCMSGLPITAIVLHTRNVLRALDQARSELFGFPRQEAPNRKPPREALPLEKVAIFAVLPYLLIQIWGTIHPDAYRNTPWTGTRLDLTSVVGVAALVWLGWRRATQARRAAVERAAEYRETGSRSADFVARARSNLT